MSSRPPTGVVRLRPAGPGDLPVVEQLLIEAKLPLDGIREGSTRFLLAEVDGLPAGIAGLERYGTSALLRSVAVSPQHQGKGIADALVRRLLEEARCDCIHDVYLRTTTAEGYFPKFGFAPVSVEAVPEAVQGSVEFRGACPASAVTMACCLARDESATHGAATPHQGRPVP